MTKDPVNPGIRSAKTDRTLASVQERARWIKSQVAELNRLIAMAASEGIETQLKLASEENLAPRLNYPVVVCALHLKLDAE